MEKLLKVAAISVIVAGGVGYGTEAFAADVTSKGDITFTQNTDPGKPEVPGTGEEIDPGTPAPTPGPLSINYVSNIHFADQMISGNNEVYYANLDKVTLSASSTEVEVPNFVQVSDNRGSNAGWHLTVEQVGQFKNGASTLTGAKLSFQNATMQSSKATATNTPTAYSFELDPAGTASDVVDAAANKGMGTWSTSFGDATTAAQSISLSVPGDTAKIVGKYEAELKWTLTDTPA
ncbi:MULTISPECIES: WxL domain-containing protein [Listeria]|uniref:WxL domain-containing protein n=1 Tax=Listeria TaxID=1637 RepID=UPI000B5950EA|nr:MULTISPECIES: WxL domain-containing protein [Listeria]